MLLPSILIKDFNKARPEIEKKVKETPGLVVVDFGAPWCPDCRRLSAGLPKLVANNPDVLFLCVDVDKVPNARADFQIRHIPDVRFYKGDLTELGSIVEGSAAQVQEKINQLR